MHPDLQPLTGGACNLGVVVGRGGGGGAGRNCHWECETSGGSLFLCMLLLVQKAKRKIWSYSKLSPFHQIPTQVDVVQVQISSMTAK